jgi:hypothetical protein
MPEFDLPANVWWVSAAVIGGSVFIGLVWPYLIGLIQAVDEDRKSEGNGFMDGIKGTNDATDDD